MPCKFADLGKKAADVLNEDHQTKGFAIKSKQKTSWDGAVLTTACDLFSGKDEITTPGKVTWKFPKPAGFNGISIDKFEIDKKGGLKLEAVADNNLHKVKDLKIEFKSDLKNLEAVSKGITFTGIKDTQIKAEIKPLDPSKFSAEITRSVNIATVGVKFGGAGVPDVGLNVAKGPAFAAVTAGAGFTVFNVSGMYSINDKLKVAATFEQGGKKSGAFSAGGSFALQSGTSVKAKIDHEQNASLTLKHEISKGVTILTGASYGVKKGDVNYGFQISVE
jgi:hypothetical protein